MNTAVAAFANAPAAACPAVDWAEMVSHRDALVRFAQRRLIDPMLAEDVVHDVFEAVIAGRAAFAGRSALRSWLTAILKHKIVDLVRQRAKVHSLDRGTGDDETGVRRALQRAGFPDADAALCRRRTVPPRRARRCPPSSRGRPRVAPEPVYSADRCPRPASGGLPERARLVSSNIGAPGGSPGSAAGYRPIAPRPEWSDRRKRRRPSRKSRQRAVMRR